MVSITNPLLFSNDCISVFVRLEIHGIITLISSMSSGPWVLIFFGFFCLLMEHMKPFLKPLILLIITGCVFVEVVCNRSFYFVLVSFINPLGGTGWHRAHIFDSLIQDFDRWWLFGYRGLDPEWTANTWTDVCSMFVMSGVQSGIFGIIGFCGIIICGMRGIVRLYNSSSDPRLRSWAWALGSTLMIVAVASLECGFRGQVQFLFYVILGMIGSSFYSRPKGLESKIAKVPRGKLSSRCSL